MAKPNATRVEVSEAEIAAAIARGRQFERESPRALQAFYRRAGDTIVIRMAGGAELTIPRPLLQGLEGASLRKVAQVQVLGPGTMLHWPELDVDHGLTDLLCGVFGNRQWMRSITRGTASQARTRRRILSSKSRPSPAA